MFISKISVNSETGSIAYSDFVTNRSTIQLITERTDGNWGDLINYKGKMSRQYLNYGSIYHKLPFMLTINKPEQLLNINDLKFTIEYCSDQNNVINIDIFSESFKDLFNGVIKLNGSNEWETISTDLIRQGRYNTEIKDTIPETLKRYGSKSIELTNIIFLDKFDNEKYVFDAGSIMTIRMFYRINSALINENPIICATFEKDGIIRTHRIMTDQLRFSATKNKTGHIDAILSPILFGPGIYHVSFTIFMQGYFDNNRSAEFFSAANDIYDFHLCTHEIEILNIRNSPILNDVYFIHPSNWKIN